MLLPATTGPPPELPLILGLTPCELPDARLAAAIGEAGGMGIIDLGPGDRHAVDALAAVRAWRPGGFGVRMGPGCALRPSDVITTDGAGPRVIIYAPGQTWSRSETTSVQVLVEVIDAEQARAAVRARADGVIVRGAECGGAVGELSTFVLLQQVLSLIEELDSAGGQPHPVWAMGGIGPRTAAAAVMAGARGVVLDVQLALLAEATPTAELADLLRRADGTRTTMIDGCRVLDQSWPGLPEAWRERRIPLGQDVFLAADFASRYQDVPTVLRAVTAGVDAALRPGRGRRSLGDNATSMSRALGTRLPIVQGPMTRVSDQPHFAVAVADGGGLPCISLALADRAQTRSVLQRTRSAMAGRPWGVGVLGFAPEEVRAAQLQVIREQKPTHAIVAGGRPAQAAELEAEGIRTFLHVPSPGLLRQFLDAGVRRFVFEGGECGGHTGPYHSFPLWEAQAAVLEDWLGTRESERPEVQVLFAGGIHDERSAAMCAALSVSMTLHGVAVGSLMGTAYLFTREAVSHGAIAPLFQTQVIAATRTMLLDTAPGHTTRCVPSAFGESYRGMRRDLGDQGVPDRQIWDRLERVNIGRLRIAAKGVERIGDRLEPVGEDRQLAEGLFMAGQVAVLRNAVCTVDDLHRQVTDGAIAFYDRRIAEFARASGGFTRQAPAPVPEPCDVAIVGMAGVFPGAADLPGYWALVLDGTDAVTEVPADRWDPDVYFGPDAVSVDRCTSKWGGFLPRIPFDPMAFGIPPTALASIEPVQLLALEIAGRALADAGLDRKEFPRERTCVVFGVGAGGDAANATTLRTVLPSYVGRLPADLAEQLPRLTEDTFPGLLANIVSGRIANRLDLGGAGYTVDAACASGLAALDIACKELAVGAADVAVCGGADLHNGINDFLLFSVHALSPTGRCRPFAADADGIALGEAVACVVLKRLADAERDGDRVYAVVRGIGAASDGRSMGLTAPRPEGQRAALERAYAQARISPARVGLVEAHGTGTVVGDRTELAALEGVFSAAGAKTGSCVLGSVKSQIGHTKCAAGLAGLIKSALAVYTGVLPGTMHVKVPNTAWHSDSSPFVFHDKAVPWVVPAAERVAAVSAFGFGGTNFHAVLTGNPGGLPPRLGRDEWPGELFVLRGARAVAESVRLCAANDAAGRPWRLRDLAYTSAGNTKLFASDAAVTAAFVARDLDDLSEKLEAVADGRDHREVFTGCPQDGELAFLFPGQGSQRSGMLADLLITFPETQRHAAGAPTEVMYPPLAFGSAESGALRAHLTDTRAAQPALGAVSLAVHAVLDSLGIRPAMAAGHSYGELVALCVAGVLDPAELIPLSRERAAAVLGAIGEDPGAMAAVTAGTERIDGLLGAAGLGDQVVCATDNAPDQAVISGPTLSVTRAMDVLAVAGLGVRRLPVACAFHSPLVAGAVNEFARTLRGRSMRPPEFPVWANLTAAVYPDDPDAIRGVLAQQIGAPVRFREQVEAMYAAGARIFVEAGPGSVLTRLVGLVLGERPHLAVAFDARPEAGLAGYLESLARLAAAGVPMSSTRLFTGRDVVMCDAAGPPRRPGWTVDGHLVRTVDGRCLPGGLAPPRRITELSSGTVRFASETDVGGGQEQRLEEFLRGCREMIAAQRDVLVSYFGTAQPGDRAVGTAKPEAGVTVDSGTVLPPAGFDPGAGRLAQSDVLGTVLAVVSERTGYPIELIDPELDLEADLSIDSIKRAEIAGELGRRLFGHSAVDARAADLEDLAQARTAAAIAAWLSSRLEGTTGTVARIEARDSAIAESGESEGCGRAPIRYLLDTVSLAPPVDVLPTASLTAAHYLVVGEQSAVTAALVERLNDLGADARQLTVDEFVSAGTVSTDILDGLIYIGSDTPGSEPVLPTGLPVFQRALAAGLRRLLTAVPSGDETGLPGFFKTLAREYPDTVCRLVEIDSAASPSAQVETLVEELLIDDRTPHALRTLRDQRCVRRPRDVPLGAAHLAEHDIPTPADLGLDADSVVIVIGGARGIAAGCAVSLAAVSGCRVELFGRTSLSDTVADGPDLASAVDRAALRSALASRGGSSLADVDREVSRILARRAVTTTMERIREVGGNVGYRSVDIRDAAAIRRALEGVYARHGRIDGVIHAAGVLEDKLLRDKTVDSFARVYRTKVDGAHSLLRGLDSLTAQPRFVVFFGSVAAVIGNRGQSDYAAANDALATIARRWSARTGIRALTLHWGPRAPTSYGGMVTPELVREYARRGIELIDPDRGALALLRELAWGGEDEVVYAAPGSMSDVSRPQGSGA